MIDLLSSWDLKERMCLVHLLEVGLQETTSNATAKHDVWSLLAEEGAINPSRRNWS